MFSSNKFTLQICNYFGRVYFSFWSIEKPEDSVVVKLVVSLLQLSKAAVNHPGGTAVLGELLSPTTILIANARLKLWPFSMFFPLLFCIFSQRWPSGMLKWVLCLLFSHCILQLWLIIWLVFVISLDSVLFYTQ